MAVENDKISFYGGVAFLDGGQAAGKLLTSDASGNVSWQSPTTTYGSLLTATGFKTSSGTSSQFLKADGSIDSNSYLDTTAGGTVVGKLVTSGTATTAGFNLTPLSADPSAPVNGDIWLRTNDRHYYRASGVTYEVMNTISGQVVSGQKTFQAAPILSGVSAALSITGNGTIVQTGTGTWTLNGALTNSALITASGFKTPSGTSTQFLKADGTVDSADYIPKTSASLSAGTIVAGKYLGLDSSNNVVLGAVSGGGSTFSGTVTSGDSAWFGNTNYTYTATVTGATTTKPAFASLHQDLITALINAGCDYSILATCTAANTVKVVVRVTNYVSLPTNKTIYVGAF